MSFIESIVTQPESTYLHLSSEYGVRRGTDTNDIVFTLPKPIISENPNYVMMIGVASMTIPHLWYNLYGVNWNMIVYNGSPSGINISGSITYQNYNVNQLTVALQSSINSAFSAAGIPSTMVVGYDQQKSKLVFSYPSFNFAFIQIPYNCYFEMGMSSLATGLVSLYSSQQSGANYVLTSPGAVDLSSYHGIFVCMPQARPTVASYSKTSLAPVLARIPVRSQFTAVETYEPSQIQYRLVGDDNLRELHITLTGDDGKPLVLHECNWTVSFHVKFVLKELAETIQAGVFAPQGVQFFPGRSSFAQSSSNLMTTGI